MLDEASHAFTVDEARAFIRRYGLKAIAEADVNAMAAAMERITVAGLTVPRVPTKFDAPAPVFRVLDVG